MFLVITHPGHLINPRIAYVYVGCICVINTVKYLNYFAIFNLKLHWLRKFTTATPVWSLMCWINEVLPVLRNENSAFDFKPKWSFHGEENKFYGLNTNQSHYSEFGW